MALFQAAGQLISCGLGTSHLTCVHSEDQAEGPEVATRGMFFSHQSTSGNSFKASIYILPITSLWPNQVTWPTTGLIGQGNICLPKGKGERCA